MTKIYVAGAYAERAVVSGYLRRLRHAGMEITLDWPAYIASLGKPDWELTYPERQKAAEFDLKGVEDCEIFWLMIPDNQSKGSWVELGYALGFIRALMRVDLPRAYGPRTMVASGNQVACIFTSADGIVVFNSHERAFEAITGGGLP